MTLNPGTPGNPKPPTTIANLRAGDVSVNSLEAVNGSQLYSTNQNVANVDNRVTSVDKRVTQQGDLINSIDLNGTKYFRANSTGKAARAIGIDSVAIGPNAEADNYNVALGANALASGDSLQTPAYNPSKTATIAGLTPIGEVSVGSQDHERRITNVAAGALETDAVNVSQLKAVVGQATNDAVQYDDGTHTHVTLNKGGDSVLIQNLHDGEVSSTSKQAINGSQLNETNQNVSNIDGRVTQQNDTINRIDTTGTKYFQAHSQLNGAQAIGEDSVAIGPNAVAEGDGNVALGAGSHANGSTLDQQAYLLGGIATSEISIGGRRITGLAAGATDTDAVNVQQLRRVYDQSVHYGMQVDGSIDLSTVTLGGKNGTRVRNVARGVEGTDAVNVDQLNAAITNNISGDKWVKGNPSTYVAPQAVGKNSTAVGSGAVSSGANSVVLGDQASDDGRDNVVAMGNGVKQRQLTHVAAGTQFTDAVNLGQLKPITDAFGGGTQINSDGTITGPSYTLQILDEYGKFSPVTFDNVGDALGGIGYTVQNLSSKINNSGGTTKYFNANSSAGDSKASGKESTAMGPQATASGNSSLAAGDQSQASGEQSVAIGSKSIASGDSSLALGSDAQATQTGSIAIGMASRSTGLNTIAIGSGAIATNSVAVGAGAAAGGGGAAFGDSANALSAVRGTAIGNGAAVSSTDGVALGSGAVADRAGLSGQREAVSNVAVSSSVGAVSVGSAGNERQITNVAGGTQATDAVNLRQLQAAKEGTVHYTTHADGSIDYTRIKLGDSNGTTTGGTTISNVAPGVEDTDAANVSQINTGVAAAKQYADSRVSALQATVEANAKDASAGTAAAMAMASMPQAFIPGKSMASAGVSTYQGQTALAVGVSRLSDNGRWVLKLNGSANTRGQVGVAAGVGMHW